MSPLEDEVAGDVSFLRMCVFTGLLTCRMEI